jgi:transport and Golgi organization protein 2
MCTVSYLPYQGGFILTSNRDESPDRGITEVATIRIANTHVYFPKDPHAGGSWFAFSEDGHVACLLNGAYAPYDRSQKFALSRGLVLLDSFKYTRVDDFASKYSFEDAAPFTLLLIRNEVIDELIWDGSTLRRASFDPGVEHFWSSVTLYPEGVRIRRGKLFEEWLNKHPQYSPDDIRTFHRYGGTGDSQNDFVMNRDDIVKTLSISSVWLENNQYVFNHLNLDDETASFTKTVDKRNSVAEPT